MQAGGGAAAVRIEDLLAEAGWVQSLARSLVGEGQAADDVVQETWIAVLKKPPLDDRPLRPWLARVVTNFARMQHRGESSRRRREASVAKTEALPSSSEMVERVEIHKLLAEAVTGLEEPLRETVMLRYFAGLSSAEIARRTNTPSGTVRWRLKRGLEALRERLDRDRAGRAGWMPAMVAIARMPIEGAAPVGLGGAASTASTLLSTALWSALVGLGLLALALWMLPTWWAQDPGRTGTAAMPAEVTGADQPEPLSVALRTEPSSRAEPAGELSGSSRVQPFVTMRVVDSGGSVLASATLTDPGGRSVRTGASGLLSMELEPGVHELTLRADGHVARTEFVNVAGAPVDLGNVPMVEAGRLKGRVLDEAGFALAGAEVSVEAIGSRWMEYPHQPLEEARYLDGLLQRGRGPVARARSDELGRFEFAGLAPGFVRVWASVVGRVADYSAPVAVSAGREVVAADLTVRRPGPGEVVVGRVVDANGQGVRGAEVEAARRSLDPLFFRGESYVSRAKTDREGRFRVLVDPGARYDLAARLQGSGHATVRGIAPGTGAEVGSVGVRLELAPVRTLRMALPAGGDPDAFRVSLIDADRDRPLGSKPIAAGDQPSPWQEFEVPLTAFAIEVDGPGHGGTRLGPYAPDEVPSSVTVPVRARAGFEGTVLAPGPQGGVLVPVAGASVIALEVLAADAHAKVLQPVRVGPPFTAGVRLRPLAHRTSTDDDGRFELPVLPGGEHLVRIEAPDGSGLAPAILGPLDLGEVGGPGSSPKLRVELGPGAAVTGRIVPPVNADPTGWVVGLSMGDGRVRSQRVGADGRFRFEHVPSGVAQLRWLEGETRVAGWLRAPGRGQASGSEESQHALPGAWAVVVPSGGSVARDLDLTAFAPSLVLGRLTIDGRSPGPWQVRLLPIGASEDQRSRTASGVLAPDGSFELRAPAPGEYSIEFWNAGFEPVFCVVRDEVLLEPGSRRRVDIDFATGELAGRFGEPGCTDVHHVWSGASTLSVTTRLEGDHEGRGRVRVPAGPGEIRTGTRTGNTRPGVARSGQARPEVFRSGAGAAGAPGAIPVDVIAGDTLRVDLQP